MLLLLEAGGEEPAGAAEEVALGAVTTGGSDRWVGTRTAATAAVKARPRDAMDRV
jgi:hypothetical protein